MHAFVDAGPELRDRERLLKNLKWGRVLALRLVMFDAFPLRIHRDLGAVCAAVEAG